MKFILLAIASWCFYLALPEVKIIWRKVRSGQQLFPKPIDRQLFWSSATVLLLAVVALLAAFDIFSFY